MSGKKNQILNVLLKVTFYLGRGVDQNQCHFLCRLFFLSLPLPVSNDVHKKILENEIQEEKQIRSKFDNKYQCEECNYKATRLFNLRQHIEGIHDGVKYPCKHCNYTATRVSHLQRHIKSIHEGIRYPSKQSNYKATLLDNLQKHS